MYSLFAICKSITVSHIRWIWCSAYGYVNDALFLCVSMNFGMLKRDIWIKRKYGPKFIFLLLLFSFFLFFFISLFVSLFISLFVPLSFSLSIFLSTWLVLLDLPSSKPITICVPPADVEPNVRFDIILMIIAIWLFIRGGLWPVFRLYSLGGFVYTVLL